MKLVNPLISVYITNYNYERFLKASIESVLNQTLQDFELFIIDDGSSDGSKEIIESYRNTDRITIIYQQNKGLNITNNVAMRVSKGKYIMRLDADDTLEPNALSEMSEVLESDDELGLVFPDYYYIDIDGNIIGEEHRHDFNHEVSLYDQPAHGACTMIRLSFLKRLGGYNESFTCQDGYDLWIKFVTHHKVTNVKKALFSYRRHGNNLTGNEKRILDTRMKIKDTFVKEHYDPTHSSLVIIPVRNNYINKESWPLYTYDDQSILQRKVDASLNATNVKIVAVVSSDKEILEFANNIYGSNERVRVIERPDSFGDPNHTLSETIDLAIETVEAEQISIDSVMTVTLEYPFLETEVIDDMVNTLYLFQSDSVLSVRVDNKLYFKHSGHSLVPILERDKFTKIEREALYKGAGGITLSKLSKYKETKIMLSGVVSHVIVDDKNGFAVFDNFDFQLFKSYNNREEKILN